MINSNIKVSVIIPTYNSKDYIVKAIDSVLAQTYKNIEIIVVDDGSTDNTEKTVSSYLGKIDYFYKKNGGVSSARNAGIIKSTGEFICFLDADDLYEETKIEKQLSLFLENNKYGMVYSDMALFDERGAIAYSYHGEKNIIGKSGNIFKEQVLSNLISTITVMAKKVVFNDVGLFDEGLRVGEDYDMWLRVTSKYEVGYVPEVLSFYRRGHQSLTTRKPGTSFKDPILVSIIKKHLAANPELRKEIPSLKLRKRLFSPYFDSGWSQYHSGNQLLAFKYFKAGLLQWPFHLKSYFYCIGCFVKQLSKYLFR